MKRVMMVIAIALLALPAMAQNETQYPSYIQTNGHAEREIVPDRFWLTITVDEGETKGKVSVEQKQKELVAALDRLGIDTRQQLRMADLSSQYYRRNSSVATAEYQLELHSTSEVTAVYRALDEIGIPNVVIQRVSHSEIDRLKEEIRVAAIRNAQQNARTLAEALGQEVGPCFYIYDSNSDIQPYYMNNGPMMRAKVMMDAECAAIESEPALDFRTIKLEYNVQTKFVLKE